MEGILSRRRRLAAALALTILVAAPATASAKPIVARPAGPTTALAPKLAALPASTCTVVGTDRTCDLWAEGGATNLPDGSGGALATPVWGYSFTDAPVTVPGGPTIIANQGETLHIVMHNALPISENLSFDIPGIAGLPDTTGVAQGASATYDFTNVQPGTYTYEAGPTENARHQVAMGLYGALVVRAPDVAAAALTAVMPGDNNDIAYTAVGSGAGGNSITIAYVDAGANQALAVAVTNSDIVVTLATDASDVVTSTANDVVAAITADPAASALVTAALTASDSAANTNDGTGLVAAMPATNLAGGQSTAYGNGTTYDDEALLVLSTIDPAFNATADPSTFDMKRYKPTYWLINGRTYNDSGNPATPSTDPIKAAPGDRVLLRYVNASLEEHSMGLLGLRQTVLSTDGRQLPYSLDETAETVPAGATMDAITTLPNPAPPGQLYPLSDQGQHLDLAGAGWSSSPTARVTAGGMLTFVKVPLAAGPCAGPAVTDGTATPASVNPAATPPDQLVSITAAFAACGGKNVDNAEYFVDALGADGTGTGLGPIAPAAAASFAFTLDSSTLTPGEHTVFIHAHDDGGAWGGYDAETFFVDGIGPDVYALKLDPNPTNGSANVALTGTADDSLNGNQNVTAAEYFIDPADCSTVTGGTGTALTFTPGLPITDLSGTLAAADVAALAEGTHTVCVDAQDAFGNWGAPASVTLAVDKTGPSGSAATIGPSPNNGTISIDSNSFDLEAQATFTDPVSAGVNSNIVAAEGFMDTVGATGTGASFIAVDSFFDSPSEAAYLRIPLADVNALAEGTHTFYTHGKDAAGNWGPFVTASIVIDKTGPAVSGLAFDGTATVTATATDPVSGGVNSNIAGAEWYLGDATQPDPTDSCIVTDPGNGGGTAMTATDAAFDSTSEGIQADLSSLAPGNYRICVRALDAAGNWGATQYIDVTIPVPVLFANSFAAGNLAAWSSATGGSALQVTAAAKLHGADPYGLQVTLTGKSARFVQDNTPTAQANYNARFWFNPNGAVLGTSKPVIFAGLNSTGKTIVSVQLERTSSGAFVRAAAALATGTKVTTWFPISNAAHAIEVDWSATGHSLVLYVDGAKKKALTNLTNGSYRVDTARLGPSSGLGKNASGKQDYDAFTSATNGYIGP